MNEHNRLPKVGERCTPQDILKVCTFFGYRDLARRIEEHLDVLDNFVSDGCSMWPDERRGKDYRRCCIVHDMEYWVGGSQDDKFRADCRLAICVSRHAGYKVAEAMFMGVRAGGTIGDFFRTGWRWGYGRQA